MCKKMLQGLFGGGGSMPAAPATAQPKYAGGKEGEVLGTIAAPDEAATATKLSGGLDPKRKGKGVPGLGL